MKGRWLLIGTIFLFLGGCAATGGFPPQTAEETKKIPPNKHIEMALTPGSFGIAEVEFHVDQKHIPVAILRRAKERMKLTGEIEDCEIEYHGGAMYYEVTGKVQGKDQEVMFTADGQEYRWEVEIDTKDVPKPIMTQAGAAVKGAVLKKAEQILNANWEPYEYHFKMEKDGIKYKVIVPLKAGDPVMVYRETLAEIEVPVN